MTQQPGSTRPYLLRAMHEWMTDNGQTPLVLVDAGVRGVEVPPEYVKDNQLVLNIAWSATHQLRLGNDVVEFEARFGGVSRHIRLPVAAIQAIYARESGQGMSFAPDPESAPDDEPEATPPPKRPGLKIVK